MIKKKAAVIATGWLGDTIACTAAATSLAEYGYQTTLFIRWPQLKPILDNDKRFLTRRYWHINFIKLFKPILSMYYDKIIIEPSGWSYKDPFTAEIRRLAGCEPKVDYELFLNKTKHSDNQHSVHNHTNAEGKPVIAVSRDLEKRAYGRNLAEFISELSKFAIIKWVGLPSNKSSKQGVRSDILDTANSIHEAKMYIGPEGGLLWLAAGIGCSCVYFTEHILHLENVNHKVGLDKILGSKNHFPTRRDILSLHPYCTNAEAIQSIIEFMKKLGTYRE